MSTTSTLFDMTQLAEASYTRFSDAAVSNEDATKSQLQDSVNRGGDFAAAQATDFVKNWRLVAHQANTPSGFSASVFERLDSMTGAPSGQYTFAFRGTEVSEQLRVDLREADLTQLVLNGAATNQIIDLYNFVQRVTHANDATIRQARIVESTTNNRPGDLGPGVFGVGGDITTSWRIQFDSATNTKPPGEAVIPSSGISASATGHSLGGHLAVAFSRLFPEISGEVFTANGSTRGQSQIVFH